MEGMLLRVRLLSVTVKQSSDHDNCLKACNCHIERFQGPTINLMWVFLINSNKEDGKLSLKVDFERDTRYHGLCYLFSDHVLHAKYCVQPS